VETPFQVLAILLERSGEIVTREELQKKLWPADTFEKLVFTWLSMRQVL
jgi:DNA-binding winged helix-turn-helix (wHTH) protein